MSHRPDRGVSIEGIAFDAVEYTSIGAHVPIFGVLDLPILKCVTLCSILFVSPFVVRASIIHDGWAKLHYDVAHNRFVIGARQKTSYTQ